MDNEYLKQKYCHKRNKYLKTDKKNSKQYKGCSCELCNIKLSKSIYKKKYLNDLIAEINKNSLNIEFF